MVSFGEDNKKSNTSFYIQIYRPDITSYKFILYILSIYIILKLVTKYIIAKV